jgi:triacylglycerol lipase
MDGRREGSDGGMAEDKREPCDVTRVIFSCLAMLDEDGRRTPLANRLESLLTTTADHRADDMPPQARMPPANAPILRWLSSWSRPQSRAGTPPPSTTPPPPSLASLAEALHEPLPTVLPTVLPRARLPDSFHVSRSLSRGPAFLDNLTRSTLPTSSLSPPLSVTSPYFNQPPSPTPSDLLRSPPIVLTHSPPTRSSLDTLRSVSSRDHIRTMSTSSIITTATLTEPPTSPTTASWWWFQNDNKENVDTLLTEDDRAESVQQQQHKLRKRCSY